MTRLFLLLFALLLPIAPALAQEDEAEVRSQLTQFIENQLSSDNRQIRLSGIQGALSSDAVIGEISIADREGVWLRIVNARIQWTRRSLLLGRLNIQTLAADRIEVTRRPLPDESAPPPEATGFALPELPVAVNLDQLSVPQIDFGPTVFGLESSLSVAGSLSLADGALESDLAVTRLDGPGGELTLQAAYSNQTETLDLNLALSEPADGVVANALGIEGRPAVDLTLAGAGPLSDLDVNLTLDADGERIVTGVAAFDRSGLGLSIDTNVEGPIARLVAPRFRDFFGANSVLSAEAVVRDEGGVTLNALNLSTGTLDLRASGETSPDNFLRRLLLQATIADPTGDPVVLPGGGGDTTVAETRLSIDYGADASENWSGALNIGQLSTAQFDAAEVAITFGGLAQNLDQPETRRVTFSTEGAVTGISTADPAVETALGDRIDLVIDGAWTAGQPVELAEASVRAQALALEMTGLIEDLVLDGTIGVVAESIAPFSDLADRPLAGSIDLETEGTVAFTTGGFDLTFDGTADGLQLGIDAMDDLVASPVRLSGRLGRGEQGFVADAFTIENEDFRFAADGRYASEAADVTLDIALSDLALVTDRAEGGIEIQGSATGEGGPVALELQANIPTGSLAGRSLRDARFAFSGGLVNVDPTAGRPYGEGIEGMLDGRAFVDGEGVDLSGELFATAERRSLQGLDFTAGAARITGDVEQNEAGLITGEIALEATDIATLAALALTEAAGAIDARISLSPIDGMQNAALEADVDGLVVEQATVGQAAVDATIADLFGVPKIDGTLDGADISAGGVDIDTLLASASRDGTRTDFEAQAALGTGTDIALEGALEDIDTGLRLELATADFTQGDTAARLLQPVTVTVEGERITLGELAFDIDGGQVRAEGVIAETFDLEVTIAQLPLAIANTVVPDLEVSGTIDGTATVGGSRVQPDVAFHLSGSGLSAAPLRDLGLPSIDLAATGRSAGGRLALDADVTAAGGIAIAADGSIPLGEGELDLDVSLVDFPLATVDPLAGDRGLSGSLTADAALSGPIDAPRVQFEAQGSNFTATQLGEFGIDPLAVAAAGTYADNAIALDSATVSNGQGIDISASGRVPFSGSGLDLNVQGNAPLSLANRPLAERGTRVEGDLEFSVGLTGSLGAPQYSGMISTSNTAIVDPETNVQLEGISILAGIQGQQVTINSFTSRLSTGGTITLGGTISLDAAAAFPADIAITLDRTRYADGDFLIATASGSLAITGSLTRDPLISGTINVEQAEIGIPDNLGAAAALTDVQHIAPPPAVAATLERAGTSAAGDPPTPTARPSVARLDIQVNAPNRIFIRGRGLDAEVGGTISLQGPVSSLEPVGGFELIRGRLSILGRRIVFDSGTVTLIGDLDPFVNLQASSQSGDTTVIITISGRASDIDIDFSSQPVLPEDEVIARLIFDRGIAELSPFQIAQLAAAVAELSGGQNTSLLGQLRQGTGLDDLDVVTDEEGNAAVRAGRYIRDNVYLGVQAGSGDSSEVTIDLDITDNLKARGAAGAGGDTSLGLFYERDY